MNRQEQFIKKARERHSHKYDYSKVDYVNACTKVCILCHEKDENGIEHGEFWVTPQNHLKGCGCKKCASNKYRKSTKEFINEAKKIHGDKYDYSKVEYKNALTKVCIICHEKDENGVEHGEFWQTPNQHLSKKNCPKCAHRSYKYTTEEYIEKANKIHNNKYDYSNVNYISNKTKIRIICPEHGEFMQKPLNHLNGQGCPKCAHRSYKYSNEEFIEKARKVHGDKYDYSKVNYVNNNTKICIICPEHGEFMQIPINHLNGAGCPKCGKISMSNKFRKTKDQFIAESKAIFGDTLDYSKVDYVNNKTKVCLICKKHGEFYVKPLGHIHRHYGCPQCAAEKNVQETILFEHIKKRFPNNNFFHSRRGLENMGLFEIDIYDEENKIGIEYQGDEHFKPLDFFGKEEGFIDTIRRDTAKIKKCKENGITLFHFTYNKYCDTSNAPYYVYTDENELFNELEKIYANRLEKL